MTIGRVNGLLVSRVTLFHFLVGHPVHFGTAHFVRCGHLLFCRHHSVRHFVSRHLVSRHLRIGRHHPARHFRCRFIRRGRATTADEYGNTKQDTGHNSGNFEALHNRHIFLAESKRGP